MVPCKVRDESRHLITFFVIDGDLAGFLELETGIDADKRYYWQQSRPQRQT